MTTTASEIARRTLRQFEPPPELTVSEWADRERRLPPESSAEPGQWRTDRAPYQRGIMDAVTDPAIEEVVFMKSSQVGWTEILLNILGYHVDVDPCPMMLVEPTLDLGRAISTDRLAPMFRDTPRLAGKLSDAREDDETNTKLHKTFPGGHLTIAGANSAASLASRPIRLLLADEVDRYPPEVGDEGDPLELAKKRTTTFWNRKVLIGSTPTVTGASRVDARFRESDQRYFFVPCPHCGIYQALAWRNVEWDGEDAATARFACASCRGCIEERHKAAMLEAGEWRPTAPYTGVAGFHIWEGYSPWVRLSETVAAFLKARRGGAALLRVFVNTALGETWEEQGERPEPNALLARREDFTAQVPAAACCVTAGVDTQDDRFEVQVIGWGPGEEAWVVDVHTIPGDPQQLATRTALDAYLTLPFRHASGAQLMILSTAIDSAGHRTKEVYEFVQARQHLRMYATVGRDGERAIISAPTQKRFGRNPRPVPLYTIGVDVCKALLASRLGLGTSGPGFVHFPAGHVAVDEEYFKQLTAEKLVTRYHKGIPYRQWVPTRPRNEALDTFVLNIAALRLLAPRLDAMAHRMRQYAVEQPPATDLPRPAPPAPAAPSGPAPPARTWRRSSYLSG